MKDQLEQIRQLFQPLPSAITGGVEILRSHLHLFNCLPHIPKYDNPQLHDNYWEENRAFGKFGFNQNGKKRIRKLQNINGRIETCNLEKSPIPIVRTGKGNM
ncbi:hypothetical protein LIER_41898 [Lithospermum erythrorhizon]|uniref:Uncharacterized protein n=1 Tax=Lithospermum erythrorhizon TaxID=34254 RepID=A0AAV3RJN4_LITER